MDNKMGLVATVVIGIGLIVGGMVWSGEKDRHRGDAAQEVIAMAMNSKVTIQQGIMKVDVDAESGSVIMTGEKMAHKKAAVEKKL